jgi:transposase
MMDWLPEDDIVHLIVDAVSVMELRRFEESYSTSGPGQAAFSPAMMLALLIYAYSNKLRAERSSSCAGAMPGFGSSSATRCRITR